MKVKWLSLVIAFAWAALVSEKDYIPIVMSISEGYVNPVVVMLTSLFENANSNTSYRVYILVPGDFQPQSMMKIVSLKENYENEEIKTIDMNRKFSKRRFPAPLYYRLQAASILSEEKKCIYLDGDVIVRHDLSEMYSINLDDYYVAGVRDIGSIHSEECRELGIDVDHYVCAGVMIMNLENIRKEGLEEIFIKTLDEKVITKYYNDQSVINLVCYGKILCLPNEFGLMINFRKFITGNWEKKDPIIVHFCGPEKPWVYPELTVFHKEFWNYASKTNVYEDVERLKDGRDVLNRHGKIVSKEENEKRKSLKKKKGSKSERTQRMRDL